MAEGLVEERHDVNERHQVSDDLPRRLACPRTVVVVRGDDRELGTFTSRQQSGGATAANFRFPTLGKELTYDTICYHP